MTTDRLSNTYLAQLFSCGLGLKNAKTVDSLHDTKCKEEKRRIALRRRKSPKIM